MLYLLAYLLVAALFGFHLYCNGADLQFRYKVDLSRAEGFFEFHRVFYEEGFRLWKHDFLEVHCPWSWERAKRYRLADMREYLGVSGRNHELLGLITASDCDDPAKAEAIARKAYVGRTRYWGKAFVQTLCSPITFPLVIIVALIVAAIEITLFAWDVFFGK